MFKSLKEKKLGDKASQRPKTSTPQKVPSESSANDSLVDTKSPAKETAPPDHHGEKDVASISTTEAVAVTKSGSSNQEEPNVHKKVR